MGVLVSLYESQWQFHLPKLLFNCHLAFNCFGNSFTKIISCFRQGCRLECGEYEIVMQTNIQYIRANYFIPKNTGEKSKTYTNEYPKIYFQKIELGYNLMIAWSSEI